MTNLLKWVIGVAVVCIIPVVFPIAMMLAIVYYIPVTVGGWIYDIVKKWMSDEN